MALYMLVLIYVGDYDDVLATNKPIMEKKRRARINNCLSELKSLILEAMKKDPARHTKLEKADILEMTVKHLQSIQRQRLHSALETDPAVIHKFKTGFIECAEQVKLYINQLDNVDAAVRQQLHNHLNACATNLEQLGSMTNFNNGYRGQLAANLNGAMATAASIFGATLPNPLAATLPNPLMATAAQAGVNNTLFAALPTQDLNGNSQISRNAPIAPVPMGVQLIAPRLPTGELALIMPNQVTAVAPVTANATHPNIALPNTPFAVWPHAASTTVAVAGNIIAATAPASHINDSTANLQHFKHSMIAAFSKPQCQQTSQNQYKQHQQSAATRANTLQHSTIATTSPPLSPVSSVSSHCDDSVMHTSSDFANSFPGTPHQPPKHHNFSGVLSTPPSAESSPSTSPLAVTSTPLSNGVHLQQQQVSSTSDSASDLNASPTTSTRKPHVEHAADSNDSSKGQQSSKKSLQVEMTLENQQQQLLKKPFVEYQGNNAEEGDNVWRPW